jgi:DNA-binding response OmpR family regulator
MTRPQVLFFGDLNWAEFAGPLGWLNEQADVKCATQNFMALAALRAGAFDMVVIGERRPGEVGTSFLEEVRQADPLSPIVFLLGSLCEGEARTGTPWPGAIRSYAHRFVVQMGAQFAHLRQSGSTRWTPPFTATEEDLGFMPEPSDVVGCAGRIAVVSGDRQTQSSLYDMLHGAGYATTVCAPDLVRLDEGQTVAGIVWDCAAGFAEVRTSFERLVQLTPGTPKVVLLGFPRAHDIDDALSLGATAVVSKPFRAEELLWQVGECLSC